MLYTDSVKEFSQDSFKTPGACYRGAPFWSWNTLMTKEMIEKQILDFKSMGFGGFYVHVRVGLRNQYLSDEFMDLIRFCDEKAKENGMLLWLYDEDRYASGDAGGEVTKTVFYRARWLRLTVNDVPGMEDTFESFMEKQRRNEKTAGCYLGSYDIVLEDGCLKKAARIGRNDAAEGVRWHLYIELAKETPWCNDQTYVDVLKKEAVEEFIRITHERYYEVVGSEFGTSIPAIFTDEPHMSGLKLPDRAEDLRDITLPFTEELPGCFGEVGGKDFFGCVPYLVWDRPGEEASPEKYRYYLTLTGLFSDAYCGSIYRWCEKHGLMSTGHLLSEDSLTGQTWTAGDAMRCYREFHIPGIDNLCDHRDFSAARQTASIVRQYGKSGSMSEMYGVTQWDFDFKGYKMAGDWQAALGITARVPHLAWASMNGESKRDYPAAIGWQSPWYRDYSYIEDHYARVNYCLTRGRSVVHTAVLHPVESIWLLNGPVDRTGGAAKQLEEDFMNITEWLLTGGIDFDYVAESSLADEKNSGAGGKLSCGEMEYDVVIVPGCINLRGTTRDALIRFASSGGKLIFMGQAPRYVDCRRDPALDELVSRSGHLDMSRRAVTEGLSDCREVDLLEGGKTRTKNLLHQLRRDGKSEWLFIAQAYNDMRARQIDLWSRRALHAPQDLEIRVKGEWQVTEYDTLTGDIKPLPCAFRGRRTVIRRGLYGNDSLLLRLDPPSGAQPIPAEDTAPAREARYTLPEPCGYRMDEPNVFVLDRFEYALDDEEMRPTEEILKLDNLIRARLSLPRRFEALAQPYIRVKEEVRDHVLRLRAVFDSALSLRGCRLALEEAAYCTAALNGVPVDMTPRGFYVDPAITTVSLPEIRAGRNELCLTMAYGDCTDPEQMYILGDFGVELRGAHASLTEKPAQLYWGDYTQQGFPFYTGNMTYIVRLPEGAGSENTVTSLQVPYYSGSAVKSSLNGGREEMLAFVPNRCVLKNLEAGGNELAITCLGNRYNGFGQLHMIGDDVAWQGPNSWRTRGTSWTDTYQVKPMGILTAPHIIKETR